MRRYKNFKRLTSALLACGCLLFGSGASIYASSVVSVKNEFETGLVKIELEQILEKGDTDKRSLLPGDNFTRIARVHNKSAECYVRLYQELDVKDILSCSVSGTDWKLGKDGYYYYTKPVKEGKYADANLAFSLPIDYSDQTPVTIKQFIRVEAVQTANFKPDFDSDKPWGDTKVIDAIYESGEKFKVTGEQRLSIIYQGDSKKLVKNANDAFINFGTLMPGDTYTDTLHLSNNSDKDVKIYFKSEVGEKNKLYDALQLKIECVNGSKSKVIYDGALSGSEISKNVLLADIASKKEIELKYTLTFPSEYDNEYTLMDGDITWIFSTEDIDVKKEEQKEADDPGTGDKTLAGVLMMVGGIACLTTVFVLKKKGKEEDK